MYYVYLLRSKKDKGFYIGRSKDLKVRFAKHNKGLVTSTKHRVPLQLVYYEAYNYKQTASKRENCLKVFGSAYMALLKRLGFK